MIIEFCSLSENANSKLNRNAAQQKNHSPNNSTNLIYIWSSELSSARRNSSFIQCCEMLYKLLMARTANPFELNSVTIVHIGRGQTIQISS